MKQVSQSLRIFLTHTVQSLTFKHTEVIRNKSHDPMLLHDVIKLWLLSKLHTVLAVCNMLRVGTKYHCPDS